MIIKYTRDVIGNDKVTVAGFNFAYEIWTLKITSEVTTDSHGQSTTTYTLVPYYSYNGYGRHLAISTNKSEIENKLNYILRSIKNDNGPTPIICDLTGEIPTDDGRGL